MADIKTWSATAASNTSTPPDGAPEGMLPSTVNNTIRELMAAVRRQYDEAEWINNGDTCTFASASSFTIAGVDRTSIFTTGRRVRIADASTLYGTVSSSSFSTDTTVNVTLDSGSLTTSMNGTTVAYGIVNPSNTSLPKTVAFDTITTTSSVTVGFDLTVDGFTTLQAVTAEDDLIVNGGDIYVCGPGSNPTQGGKLRFSEDPDGAGGYFEFQHNGSTNQIGLYASNLGSNVFDIDRLTGKTLFNQEVEVNGAFTSLGIDDNATNTILTLGDSSLELGDGTDGEIYAIGVNALGNNGRLFLGGDANAFVGTGAKIILAGGAYTGTAGDFNIQSEGANVVFWDESAGSFYLYTGSGGTKTQALQINSSQAASFSGDVTITGTTSTPLQVFRDNTMNVVVGTTVASTRASLVMQTNSATTGSINSAADGSAIQIGYGTNYGNNIAMSILSTTASAGQTTFHKPVIMDDTLSVNGSTLNVGVNDSTAATLSVFGNGTGSAEGGELRLYLAADHDATFSFYGADAYQDDMRIYRSDASWIHYFYSSGTVDFNGQVIIDPTNNGAEISIDDWNNTSNPDIFAALGGVGSNSGVILEGPPNAHLVIGLRDNDIADQFAVVGTGASYGTDNDYDDLLLGVKSDGTVTIPTGNLYLGDPTATHSNLMRIYAQTSVGDYGTLRCTDGNVHLDSSDGNSLYLNYYQGEATVFGNGATGNIARITIGGAFYPETTNTGSVGTNTNRWANIYGVNLDLTGTINTPLAASRAVVTDGSSNLTASTVTSAEVGYLDGVTSNIQTQLDAKLESTDTYPGKGVFVNNSDGSLTVDSTVFTLNTTITTTTWESIGPTGSGADNIWTALDSVPVGADWIEVYVNAFATDGTASTDVEYAFDARKNGSTATGSSTWLINLSARVDASGDARATNEVVRRIPVDANVIFEMREAISTFTNLDARMHLTGYGYNA